MKRGIDLIRVLYPQPTEYERLLALDALAHTWDGWVLRTAHGDHPALWWHGVLLGPIRDRVHQPFWDSLTKHAVFGPALGSLQ